MSRSKKDPLKGHPREAETRQAMLAAHFEDAVEVTDLQASELACDVADAWVNARLAVGAHSEPSTRNVRVLDSLRTALDRLEAVTRPSAMRKMQP